MKRPIALLLSIMLLALCSCGAVKPSPTPALTPSPTVLQTATPAPTEPVEPVDAATTPEPTPNLISEANIMLVGDVMCLAGQQSAAKAGDSFDFTGSFEILRDILEESDLAVGNLETLVAGSIPITSRQKEINGYPHCNAPPEFLDALIYAGFNAFATANNHCCDGKETGILETIEALDAYGLAHTGTFASPDEPRFIIMDVNDIKVAIMSYSEIFNQKHRSLQKENREFMINEYSAERAAEDVRNAREAGAEFIIAYTHWGVEDQYRPTSTQRKHAQELADAGVDVIAGSHSHRLSPFDVITASDGRQVPCMYSMGNFVSSMGSTANNDTLIFSIDIERDTHGSVTIASYGYIPCRVFSRYENGRHVVIPTPPNLNGGIESEALESAYRRIDGDIGEHIYAIGY